MKGNSLKVCMNKILMEDDHKQVIQPQRRLNPAMKEMVCKEVVKLLDASRTTIIMNEKNELIPTRTVIG